MATEVEGMLPVDLKALIDSAKVFVVGAGGIGCELLKNLVLTGFKDIHVIDLDTIEVSNLNRQFLFRREHVGQPKSIIAKESALIFNPAVNIVAYHDSILETKYDVGFYKQFTMVLNALDNRQARSHVNRMCLAADIPLLESGSAGYNGHVSLHKKGVSECFDCTPRAHQKTFPGCTIRNTPSEPIHCIVWGKHLFNQLFGLADADEDVSPDSADPEAIGDAGAAALEADSNREKVSTRQWAINHNYNTSRLFKKLFNDDIRYLLSMKNLWLKRKAPTPLEWEELENMNEIPSSTATNNPNSIRLKDQILWSIKECVDILDKSIIALRKRIDEARAEEDKILIWDKDDDVAMDFVTSVSNIRCFIFGITQKSRFDTKSMAGNIIPAIASTNAMVAGLIVMRSFNVLRKEYLKCSTIYVGNRVNVRKELFATEQFTGPNPKCYVCTEKPEIVVKIDLERLTVRMLGEKILKKELNMISPDVEIDDGQGTIIISSEEGETDDIADKLLSEFGIKDGSRLKCDDFHQNFELNVTVISMEKKETSTETAAGAGDAEKARETQDILYEIIGDKSQLAQPKPEKVNGKHGDEDQAQAGEKKIHEEITINEQDDDCMVIIDDDDQEDLEIISVTPSKAKRPRTEEDFEESPESVIKKRKLENKSGAGAGNNGVHKELLDGGDEVRIIDDPNIEIVQLD